MDYEIWDEERWEDFLRQSDRRVERYMSLFYRFIISDPPIGAPGSVQRSAWEARLRVFMQSNGIQVDDVLFETWDAETAGADDVLNPGDDETADAIFGVHGGDEVSVPFAASGFHEARQLAVRVLRWSNTLPISRKDSTYVQFCSCITQIPGNLAKGHEIGYEMETIGGNIACAKRALAAANAGLDLLREMKTASYMSETFYRALYEAVYDVRNDIGIHVQSLRERFNLGVD